VRATVVLNSPKRTATTNTCRAVRERKSGAQGEQRKIPPQDAHSQGGGELREIPSVTSGGQAFERKQGKDERVPYHYRRLCPLQRRNVKKQPAATVTPKKGAEETFLDTFARFSFALLPAAEGEPIATAYGSPRVKRPVFALPLPVLRPDGTTRRNAVGPRAPAPFI